MPAEISPHVIMMRAIQTRAPYLTSSRLLGTSQIAYARKKMPAPAAQDGPLIGGTREGGLGQHGEDACVEGGAERGSVGADPRCADRLVDIVAVEQFGDEAPHPGKAVAHAAVAFGGAVAQPDRFQDPRGDPHLREILGPRLLDVRKSGDREERRASFEVLVQAGQRVRLDAPPGLAKLLPVGHLGDDSRALGPDRPRRVAQVGPLLSVGKRLARGDGERRRLRAGAHRAPSRLARISARCIARVPARARATKLGA